MLKASCFLTLAATLPLYGCMNGTGLQNPNVIQSSEALKGIHGIAHGGQQGISGSTIALRTVGTNGYTATGTTLATTTTDANGYFDITGLYTCPNPDQEVYITASGGNPGLANGTNNTAIFLMGALTDCNTLQANAASTFIVINEVTTIAAAYALGGFMSASNGSVGSYGYATTGIENAFLTANNIVDTSTGLPRSVTPAGNGAVSAVQINTPANILAPCVNSSSSASTPCATLFSNLQPTNGVTPTNTLLAALSLAQHPGSNVAALFGIVGASPPFEPTDTSAPNDWTIAINFDSGVSSPSGVQVDAKGNIFFASEGNIGEMDPTGKVSADTPIALGDTNTGNLVIDDGGKVWEVESDGGMYLFDPGTRTLSAPITGLGSLGPGAFDANGMLWITSPANNSVIEYNPFLNAVISPPGGYTAALNIPNSIAIKPSGSVLVGDSTSVTPFSSIGVSSSAITGIGGIASPTGVAIGPLSVTWISNGNGALSELNSSNAALSPSSGFSSGGSSSSDMAVDGFGNVFVGFPPSAGKYAFAEFNSSGTLLSPGTGYQNPGLTSPTSSAPDLSGNLWVTNQNKVAIGGINANVTEFIGLGGPTNSPLVYSVKNNEFGNRPGARIVVSIRNGAVPPFIPGALYSTQMFGSGGNSGTYLWSASGLPSGLSIDPSSGIISGTTNATTSTPATITLQDAANTANSTSKSFSFVPYAALPAGSNEIAVSGSCYGGAMGGHEFPSPSGLAAERTDYLLSFCFNASQQITAEWVRSSPFDTAPPSIVSGAGTYNFNSQGLGELFLIPSDSPVHPPIYLLFAGTDNQGGTTPQSLKTIFIEEPGTSNSSVVITGGGSFDILDKTAWAPGNLANSSWVFGGSGELVSDGPAAEAGQFNLDLNFNLTSGLADGATFGNSFRYTLSGSAGGAFDSFGFGTLNLTDSGTAFSGRYDSLDVLTINANKMVGLTAGAHSLLPELRYDFHRQTGPGAFSNSILTGNNYLMQYPILHPLNGGETFENGLYYLSNQGAVAGGWQFGITANKNYGTGAVGLGLSLGDFVANIDATGRMTDTTGTTAMYLWDYSGGYGVTIPSTVLPRVGSINFAAQTAPSSGFGCPTGGTMGFGSGALSLLADNNSAGQINLGSGLYYLDTIAPNGTLTKSQVGTFTCAPGSLTATIGEITYTLSSSPVLLIPQTSTRWNAFSDAERFSYRGGYEIPYDIPPLSVNDSSFTPSH